MILFKILLFVFVLLPFFFLSVFAQEDKKNKIPPGMEIVEVGGANILLPEGTKIRKEGGLIIPESTSEYVARKLLDLENRIKELEKKEAGLKNEIEHLKTTLQQIQSVELMNKNSENTK